jgi:hypothetical protein
VCYVRADFQNDGVHPADGGRDKVARMIHERFLREAWYRAPDAPAELPDAGAPPPAACAADRDCRDDDPCTRERCADGACAVQAVAGCTTDYTPCAAAAACDDGDAATDDACIGGVCVHRPAR